MSVESLPYTLLLLLAQLTAGNAAVVLFAQLKGDYEPAFLRTCTWMTMACALMTALLIVALNPPKVADGYLLDPSVLDPAKGVAVALLLFTGVHMYFLRRTDEQFLANATGATTAALGVVLLVLLASFVRLTAWSIAGPLITLFAGALTLGVFSVAMIWGHWYLVKPTLEEGPLNLLILIAMGSILVETVATAVNAIIPVGVPVHSNALLAVGLATNPGFWLRIGIGLVFPGLLAFMAYVSSKQRAMMSATGLLYIAVGALLAGEALGRGLLFVTGAPV